MHTAPNKHIHKQVQVGHSPRQPGALVGHLFCKGVGQECWDAIVVGGDYLVTVAAVLLVLLQQVLVLSPFHHQWAPTAPHQPDPRPFLCTISYQ